MESTNPAIKGVVIVDSSGRIALTIGVGADRRVRALAGDAEWLDEARKRRLQPLIFDNADYVLLVTHFQEGDLIVISEPPGQTLLDFIGSVDFAYEIIDRLLSDPFEGMTVIDNKKRLRYISPVHEKFFGLRHGEANGRPVRDVIENTKLDRVIDTGRVEIGELQRVRGLERIVSRIPIKRDGEVIGAYGRVMFKGPQQIEGILRRLNTLEGEVEFYKREAAILRARTYGLENLIGSSPAMRNLRSEIIKIAPLEIPVLIRGESGTGKELVAHSLHQLSPRRDAAMVMVNSAALPATLVESELFGYEAGAFTGANKKGRKGKFEQASGGTIFLDEIGDMPLEVQVKLLRVLQDQMVERVGGDRPYQVDFRLITATNWDLKQLVTEGKFRLDLYYRISALVIEVPPLRQRIGDIPELAEGFLNDIATRHARPKPELTSDALSFLMEQRWPGNVRELRHEIERAFVFAEDGRITTDVLARYGDGLSQPQERPTTVPVVVPTEPTTMKEALAQVEVEVIRQAMTRHKGNKKRVATELGISRSYLYKMLEGHVAH
ncbi:MAG: sigma 54-interacting transcriptional regulator [Rhodopila sp.]|nr:sigma 54-interacting transcriptional regulator [Rhodopila sp.]